MQDALTEQDENSKLKLIKYVLHPGYVKSVNDGQRHYISYDQLICLYKLNAVNCICSLSEKAMRNFIHLYPRSSGDYEFFINNIIMQQQPELTIPSINDNFKQIDKNFSTVSENFQKVDRGFQEQNKIITDLMQRVTKLTAEVKELNNTAIKVRFGKQK